MKHSRIGPHQREHTFYEGIAAICSSTYGIYRTPDSLRCFWGRLARDVQCYLSCRSIIQNRRISGIDPETERSMVMELYRRRQGKKDADGNLSLAPPFKYIDAAMFLVIEPKFSERYENESVSTPTSTGPSPPLTNNDDDSYDDIQPAPTTALNCLQDGVAQPSSTPQSQNNGSASEIERIARPMGIKKRKVHEDMFADMKRSSIAMSALLKEVEKSNSISVECSNAIERTIGSIADIKLLQALQPGSDEYKSLYLDIMNERRERLRRIRNAATTDSDSPASRQEQSSSNDVHIDDESLC